MQNQTYYNPASFRPQMEPNSIPSGAIQGDQWARDRTRYNNLADMFQQGQQMDLSKQQMEMQEFQQQAPLRQMTEQGKAQEWSAKGRTALPRLTAETQKTELENQLSSSTLASKIEKQLIEAATSRRKELQEKEIQDLQNLNGIWDQIEQDPEYTPGGPLPLKYQNMLDSKNPLHRIVLNKGTNPGSILKAFASVDIKHIQETVKESMKEEAAMARQKYASDSSKAATLGVARIGATSREEVAAIRAQQTQVAKTAQAKMIQEYEASEKATDPKEKAYHKQLGNFYRDQMIAAAQAAGIPRLETGGSALEPGTPFAQRYGAAVDKARPPEYPGPNPQPKVGGPVVYKGYSFPNQAALDAYKKAGGQ